MTSRLHAALAGCALAVVLTGCGERPQSASTSAPVKKLDTPAANGPTSNAYVAPGWKTGDAASWEQQLKKRAQGQNEHSRITGS